VRRFNSLSGVLSRCSCNLGLNGAIAATAFAWRVGGVSYLSPAAFNFTLDAAAAANYRVDALLGNSSGTYNIF
jgi:hypothetical protein